MDNYTYILLMNPIHKILDIWKKVLAIDQLEYRLAPTLNKALSYLNKDEIKMIICSDHITGPEGDNIDCPGFLLDHKTSKNIPKIIVNTKSPSSPYEHSSSVIAVYYKLFDPAEIRAHITANLDI